MKSKSINYAVAALLAATATAAQAGIVFSYEAAGIQQTTVVGAVTETFESAGVGAITGAGYTSATIGGTYLGGQVINANQYGGAGGSGLYDVVGLNTSNPALLSQTLTFTAQKTYFGMWWSAGDASNVLEFYNGSTLIDSFTVGSVLSLLGPAYSSNPNPPPGQNTGEKYAYLNFTGTAGTTFNVVKFINNSNSGFESDNHSVYDQEITPPGTVVPEPSTYLMGALMLIPVVSGLRKLRQGQKA